MAGTTQGIYSAAGGGEPGRLARSRQGRRFRTRQRLFLFVSACLLAALLAGSARAIDPAFTPAAGSPLTVGSGPVSLAAADLNGDAKLDLAVVNYGSSDVTILLRNGTGGFSASTGSPFPEPGPEAVSVAVADLNGDGKRDLAVANEGSDGVSMDRVAILLGDGAGGFSAATGSPVVAGSFPHSVVAADLNGAGGLDLAVANRVSNNVSILVGNGTGGFSPADGSPVAAGSGPRSVAVGDLNGDGKRDLAVANRDSDDVSILVGDGAGGFSAASGSPVAAGDGPRSIVAADLNGDGKLDLAVANENAGNVLILLGNGTGGFAPAGPPVAVGSFPLSVAVADLNGDGKPDLAVANEGSDSVSILVGNGTGGFAPVASPVGVGDGPHSVAAADLNGDGKLDLAVANRNSNNVSVLLNTTNPPTAVTVLRFAARPTRGGVELEWRTAQEPKLLGFDVYRSGVKLNRTLIASRGSGAVGAAYRLLDRGARVGASHTYRLQAVRADGTRGWVARASAKR